MGYSRRPMIAGNWKMNTNLSNGIDLAKEVINQVSGVNDVDIVLCPPFTHLKQLCDLTAGTNVDCGAQNMYWEESGAFTGETSPQMIKSLGCDYVIIGHSERRQMFKETDGEVNQKVFAALSHQLKPIIAVGETLDERERDKTEEKIKGQIEKALKGVNDIDEIVVAYEPIWAIGTGKTATPGQANDVIRFIRATIGSIYTPDIAGKTRILYGGSVKPDNIKELMTEPDIDGALVGGASLEADSFTGIVKFQ